jgi:outer membrane cobalamin receptor
MRLPLFPAVALLAALVLIQGCASSGESASGSRGSGPVIGQEAIEQVAANNAYDIVHTLRPSWLRSRGSISIQNPQAGYPVVYVDGISFGDLTTLRQISREEVQRIEFVSAHDATTRYGTGHPGGIIMVITRR